MRYAVCCELFNIQLSILKNAIYNAFILHLTLYANQHLFIESHIMF